MEARDSVGRRLGISCHVPRRSSVVGDDMLEPGPEPGECEEESRLCQIWWPEHMLLSGSDQGGSISTSCSQFCSGTERGQRVLPPGDVGLIVGWKLPPAESSSAQNRSHVIVATVVFGAFSNLAVLQTVCGSLESHPPLKELHSACGSSPVVLGEYSIVGATSHGLEYDVGNGAQHGRERGWKCENVQNEVVQVSKYTKVNNVHVGVGCLTKHSRDGYSHVTSSGLVRSTAELKSRWDGDTSVTAVSCSTIGHGCPNHRCKNGFRLITEHLKSDGYPLGDLGAMELGKPNGTQGGYRCANQWNTQTWRHQKDGNWNNLEKKQRVEGGGETDWREELRGKSDLWLVMEARSMREVGTGKPAKGFPWLIAALASGKHLSVISQVIVYRQPRYQRHHYSAQRKWNPFCSWSNKGLDDVDNQKQRQEQGRSGKHSLPKKMPEWLAERERNGPIQGIQMEHVVVQLNSSRFVERMILSLSQRAIEQLPCVSDMALACALSMKVADATITRSGGSTDLQTLPNRVSRSNDKDLQYESSPDKQGNRHVDLVNQPGDKKRSWGKVKRRRRGHAVDPFSGKEEQKGSEEFVGWRIICLLVQVAHCFTLGALAAVVALVQASIWIVLTMLLPVAGLLGEWSDTWHAVVHRHAELSLGSMALKSCLERQLLEAYCLLGSSSKGGRDRKAEARIKREAWDVREAHMSALRNHGLQAEMLADMVLGMVAGILLRWQKDVVCQLLMGMGSDVSTGLMKTGMVWLMGVPAGFKLNNELANCTGRVSLYLIHGWATLCSSLVVPVLPMILDVVAVAGLSGLSVLLSLLGDLLALATCHMALLYGAMAVVYTPQLQAAGALWRMFRGQKRNPLRHRVDSYECSVEQSLVGCLMFTPLLLLLPTTSIFYIFFTVTYGAVLAIRGGLRVVLALLRGFPFFAAGVWLLLGRGWFPSGMWFKVLELERELVASGLSRKRVHVSDRVAAEKMVYPNSYLENVEIQGNSVFQGKALQAKGKVPLEHSESLGTRVLRSREGNGPKSRMGESGDGGTRNCCHIYDGKDQDRESRTERDWRDQDKTVRSSGVEEGGMATHKEMCCMDGVSMGDDCETMKGCEPERRQKSKAFARAAFENDCPRPSDSGMETENRKYIQQCVAREAIYIVVNCNGASLGELLSPFLKYIRCRFHTRFLGKLAHDLALGNRIQPLLRFADESGMRWIPASFRHTKL